MNSASRRAIESELSRWRGASICIERIEPVASGSTSRCFRLHCNGSRIFAKLNAPNRQAMFEAERAGLEQLESAAAVRVPRPIASGADRVSAWILLEYLDITAGAAAVIGLGTRLAAMHRHGAERFGWNMDNTIGASLQPNDWCEDWITFLRHRRLGFQLDLAARNGYLPLQESATRLLERLPSLFSDYRPQPSLLHGDLWNGNAGVLSNGEPVLFDPAVYFGDRESDLAMTELFGGFPPAFYAEYRGAWPLDPGYPVRKRLYNLYHLLNHLNLFGAGYLGRCHETIGQLLAEMS